MHERVTLHGVWVVLVVVVVLIVLMVALIVLVVVLVIRMTIRSVWVGFLVVVIGVLFTGIVSWIVRAVHWWRIRVSRVLIRAGTESVRRVDTETSRGVVSYRRVHGLV